MPESGSNSAVERAYPRDGISRFGNLILGDISFLPE